MSLKDDWREFKEGFMKGYHEGATKPENKNEKQKSDNIVDLYFSVPIGIGILWALAANFVNKDLGQWWQNLGLTSILFILLVVISEIWYQLSQRAKKKKSQNLRSTFAVLVDDQLLSESADINIITFQHTIFQGLLLGTFSSTISLAILFACYFWTGISQEVVFYIIGFVVAAIVSMLLLVESRLQAERRTRSSRYYQAATNYYLDRSEEIRLRNRSN